MHRHGYRGRKFGRETDQRRALTRGLMCALIKYQTITTTLARAKEIRRQLEKLITLARRGDLHSRRLVIARLGDLEAATLLCDVIVPQIERNSGYLRIEHAGYRRGDNAEMGTISFVDEIEMEEYALDEDEDGGDEAEELAAETKVEEATAEKADDSAGKESE